MVTETMERSAFVFTHSKFPDYRRIVIKKSTTCPAKLLNKLNSKTLVPGKWHLDYIMFDINFTRAILRNFVKARGFEIDNKCYKVSKQEMIHCLHQVNDIDHQVTNNNEQQFVTIYGIGVLPVHSTNH